MKAQGHRLRLIRGDFAVARLAARSAVPAWAGGEFFSVTSTGAEVSVICESARVPLGVRAERGWRVLEVEGPFAFSAVGVLASLAAPLAQAGASLLTLSTFDTDYLLVKDAQLELARRALESAGHELSGF